MLALALCGQQNPQQCGKIDKILEIKRGMVSGFLSASFQPGRQHSEIGLCCRDRPAWVGRIRWQLSLFGNNGNNMGMCGWDNVPPP